MATYSEGLGKTHLKEFTLDSFDKIKRQLDELMPQIHPDFLKAFKDYEKQVLAICGKNSDLVGDPVVQEVIGKETNNIGKVFSIKRIRGEIMTAANDENYKKVA